MLHGRSFPLSEVADLQNVHGSMRIPAGGEGAFTIHRSGFTLIELMTVLAIISILLALAYPTYLEQVRKARRADATASLMDRAHSLERCFTRLNAYDNSACPDPGGNSNDGFYIVTVDRTASEYTLTATPVADQANDPCGIFTMDYLGNKLPLPGSYRCWGF